MMTVEESFLRFGTHTSFAVDIRFLPDPDGDTAAPNDAVGSWGQWRLWVGGRNLCEYDLFLENQSLVRCNAVTWYLAPFIRWLANNWDPLLHEERLPSFSPGVAASRYYTARDAYIGALPLMSGDPRQFDSWQDWASRHSMRWAAEGGMLPDLFLRRLGDEIEISWGDRWQPGCDAIQFVAEEASVCVPVSAVADTFNEALIWFAEAAPCGRRPWVDVVLEKIRARHDPARRDIRTAWYIDGSSDIGPLTVLFRKLRDKFAQNWEGVFEELFNDTYHGRLSPAAAMFGDLSPKLTEDAAIHLLAATADSIVRGRRGDGDAILEKYMQHEPIRGGITVWRQGYNLARDFLDEIEDAVGLYGQKGIDIESLLARLKISVQRDLLGVDGPRGVALAGNGLAPTIILNTQHQRNWALFGERFTLAHELCHILYDRNHARRVTHVSTQWAPVAIEQRANAFAAMLLMPPELIRKLLPETGENLKIEHVAWMAAEMNVSLRALISHLQNLGEISEDTRQGLLSNLEVGYLNYLPKWSPGVQ